MYKGWRPILLLTIWNIWKWRNNRAFDVKMEPMFSVVTFIITQFNTLDMAAQIKSCKIKNNTTKDNRQGGGVDLYFPSSIAEK